jgi:hypothetical protein
MVETVETTKDVEKQLAEARVKLQNFEDQVDYKRLLKRLKRASPAHPVLLFRMLFMLLTLVMSVGAFAVLVLPLINGDLARKVAKFDAIVPAPPGLPGLPAFLGFLALCMIVGYAMTTLASLSLGRDAQMLPWEQTQHQKLVNEVTRLTTQKTVMERMRSTPAGARPRMNTPVPVNLRERAGIATPSGAGHLGQTGGGAPPIAGMQPGRFGPAPGGQASPDARHNPFGAAPRGIAPTASPGGAPARAPQANPFATSPNETPPGAPVSEFGGAAAGPASGGSMLSRARSGALKTTPAGAAGRLMPMLNMPVPTPAEPVTANPFAAAAPEPAEELLAGTFGEGSTGKSPFKAPTAGLSHEEGGDDGLPNIVEHSGGYSASPQATRRPPSVFGAPTASKGAEIPTWGVIDDPWLEEAIERAEGLTEDLPAQAHLDFSQEDHLPFALVIHGATPAVAVRAMVSYIEFLSTIPTPQKGRIELKTNSNLDRSFHRNVEAALEPYYDDKFLVDIEPGRVEITFSEPDPQWDDHPMLPMV